MDTTLETRVFTLQIPQSDVRFFSALAKKMGWIKKEQPTKKCRLDAALDDVEKGNLKSFDNVDELMDYLHS